jgi:hypothetical protein
VLKVVCRCILRIAFGSVHLMLLSYGRGLAVLSKRPGCLVSKSIGAVASQLCVELCWHPGRKQDPRRITSGLQNRIAGR